MEAHKFADIFPMVEGNELEVLKNDIKEHGLLNPIVLYEDQIIDGRNRYKACNEIGIEPKFETYKGTKPLEFVISLNLKRRHLTKDQRAVISLDVLPMLEEEAKKRQGTRTDLNPNIPTLLSEGESREQASKIMQVGTTYIQQAKKLSEKDRKEIKFGHKTLQDVKKEQRLEKIKVQREELQKEVLEQPKGNYDVLVIDPPWNYGTDETYNPDSFRGTTPYPTMSLEEIKNIKLPVKEDCVLWLWTTNFFLLEMKELLESWGFELKSILTWNKEIMGIGRWLRSQTEHCILAIKGKPYFNNTKWTTLISEKRTTHSTKPEIFYKMVEEICAGRKLDYFARKKREGWDVYGDEING